MSTNGEEASSRDQQKAMAGTGPRHQTQPGGKAASARDAAGASAEFLAGVPVTTVLGWGSWHGNQQAGSLGRLAMMCTQKRWVHPDTPSPSGEKGRGFERLTLFPAPPKMEAASAGRWVWTALLRRQVGSESGNLLQCGNRRQRRGARLPQPFV